MALIKCPECGGEVSDKAFACPHCGNPLQVGREVANNAVSSEDKQVGNKEAAKPVSGKRLAAIVIATSATAMLLTFALAQTSGGNAFLQYLVNISDNIGYWQDRISSSQSETQSWEEYFGVTKTDPLAIRINPDGSKSYPLQYNNLFGYEFYTGKIDSTGNIDAGSAPKQQIAKLFISLGFPPSLTKKVAIIDIDPTIVGQRDRLLIPWGAVNEGYLNLQPLVGTSQSINGGMVIALNNLSGYNEAVVTHELGHVISVRMTEQEWKEYYRLRGIPSDTPRRLNDWELSPEEDFAEAYKATYRPGSNITTEYGVLVPRDSFADLGTPCFLIQQRLIDDYIAKNKDPNQKSWEVSYDLRKKAEGAVQSNAELQSCRRKNNGEAMFGGPQYIFTVDEPTKQFIRGVVARLNAGS